MLPRLFPGILFCYDPCRDSQPPQFVFYCPLFFISSGSVFYSPIPSIIFFYLPTPLVSVLLDSVYRQNTVAALIIFEGWTGPTNMFFVLV